MTRSGPAAERRLATIEQPVKQLQPLFLIEKTASDIRPIRNVLSPHHWGVDADYCCSCSGGSQGRSTVMTSSDEHTEISGSMQYDTFDITINRCVSTVSVLFDRVEDLGEPAKFQRSNCITDRAPRFPAAAMSLPPTMFAIVGVDEALPAGCGFCWREAIPGHHEAQGRSACKRSVSLHAQHLSGGSRLPRAVETLKERAAVCYGTAAALFNQGINERISNAQAASKSAAWQYSTILDRNIQHVGPQRCAISSFDRRDIACRKIDQRRICTNKTQASPAQNGIDTISPDAPPMREKSPCSTQVFLTRL
jgi:hypothetical protein